MFQKLSLFITVLALPLTLASPSLAQDIQKNASDLSIETTRQRIVRTVEPLPRWVDTDKLRVRDNPFAGNVVGILELGNTVKVYESTENWVRITPEGTAAKWVNGDFLSNKQVTWATYSFGSRSRQRLNTAYDVDLKRIKIEEPKDARVYAAHLKEGPNASRVIVTRHDFRSGTFYEKRLVGCSDTTATHVRILGEGRNFAIMENDPRQILLSEPLGASSLIFGDMTSELNRKIAEFACESDQI